MLRSYTVELPSLGDGEDAIRQAAVAFWLADVGASLKEGDDLLEINTDKAAFVVPCPVSGILKEKLVREDEEIHVGTPLAIVEIA